MKRLFFAAVAAAACSSAPKPVSTSAPAPTAPARIDLPPCPDSTDTPGIIESNVSRASRAVKASPAITVPACFSAAVAQDAWGYADSTVRAAVALSDAVFQRSPTDAVNLQARLALLPRVGRSREVPANFNALIQRDTSKATLANYRLAIAASMRARDTAARIRLLAAAVRKYPSAASLVAENNIMRQLARLHRLPDSVHQILRFDPSRSSAYATLASVYGNLDRADSALYFTRLALSRGVPRGDVAPSLQSLIGVVLRKAQLLDAPDVWESTLPLARTIDSTLSTDASKHLYALALVQVVSARADASKRILGGPLDGPLTVPADQRNTTCANVRALPRMLDAAQQLFGAGGSRFASETMPALSAGVGRLRQQIDQLERRCAG
jgi:hypothetical protein